MTRRSALAALTAAGAGIGLVFVFTRLRRPGVSQIDAAFDLESRVGWHELGRRYLTQFPTDRDTETWIDEMREALDGADDDDQLRRAISTRITRDFTLGQIVEVEGWTLSRTEARLAALSLQLSGIRAQGSVDQTAFARRSTSRVR